MWSVWIEWITPVTYKEVRSIDYLLLCGGGPGISHIDWSGVFIVCINFI